MFYNYCRGVIIGIAPFCFTVLLGGLVIAQLSGTDVNWIYADKSLIWAALVTIFVTGFFVWAFDQDDDGCDCGCEYTTEAEPATAAPAIMVVPPRMQPEEQRLLIKVVAATALAGLVAHLFFKNQDAAK